MRGILAVVAVRAPGFGVRRKALLSDLAVLTGGRVITSDAGYSLQNTEIEYLGLARRIIVRKESTTIISDGKRSEVLERCSQLRRDLEKSKDSYDREKIQERLSRLSGGVAVIRVGGATETERKDRKLRLEDAVNAVKAAFEEGCLPGGGSILANFSKELFNWAKVELVGDELVGSLIVEKALSAPFKKILSNAGQNGDLVFEKASKMGFVVGCDASTSSTQFVNLFDIGIVDPVKVTRLALQNATSIASMVLTTECLVLGSFAKKGSV
jgi:chaperonin GroEL